MTQKDLRNLFISRRKAVRQGDASLAQATIAKAAQTLQCFSSSNKVAGYYAINGELDVFKLLTIARELGKSTYLPITQNQHNLLFAPFDENTRFVKGKYGIPVPEHKSSQLCQANQLDVVLVPLVAFDGSCNRLGMGGGYYDRCFAFRKQQQAPPWLIGTAYECQKSAHFTPQAWDVPMDIIITEQALYRSPE